MIRKLQSIALLVGALLALSGLMASTAGAAAFTSEKAPTKLTGTQDGPYKIEATGLPIECKSVAMQGTLEATKVESVKIIPLLSECSAFGFATATVTGFSEGGCYLVLHANGTGDLVCPAGKDVTVESGPCTVHMPAQNGVKTITFTKTEKEGKLALTVDFALDNLHGTHTDGFLCPFNGGGTFVNTKASGVGQVWGESESGEPIGISWDA